MSGNSVGRQVGRRTGRRVEVTADGRPENKTRGITLDWSTVAAAGADVILTDATPILTGEKYLRYGQCLTRIGVGEVQTYEHTGGPTAGSAVLLFPANDIYDAESITIAFNATGAAVQTALEGLNRYGPGNVSVARTGSGSSGSPYVYTATYARALGNVDLPTATHTFTGGTSPSETIATGTPGVGTGLFGPYDSAATDGRQTLSRGDFYILNATLLEGDNMSNHPEVIEGGRLYKQRVLMTTGTHSLAAGPTVTEVEAALPRVTWAE